MRRNGTVEALLRSHTFDIWPSLPILLAFLLTRYSRQPDDDRDSGDGAEKALHQRLGQVV